VIRVDESIERVIRGSLIEKFNGGRLTVQNNFVYTINQNILNYHVMKNINWFILIKILIDFKCHKIVDECDIITQY